MGTITVRIDTETLRAVVVPESVSVAEEIRVRLMRDDNGRVVTDGAGFEREEMLCVDCGLEWIPFVIGFPTFGLCRPCELKHVSECQCDIAELLVVADRVSGNPPGTRRWKCPVHGDVP